MIPNAVIGLVIAGVLGIGLLIGGVIYAQRKMRAAIDAAFAGDGFVLARKPDQAAREGAWAVLEPFGHLKSGAKGIQWIATGAIGGREVVAVQHMYMIHTDQSAQPVVHLCVACRCPRNWPLVELRGEHVFRRIAEALGSSDIRLESEAFNKRWHISAESEDQAILVLTPEVQTMLTDAPRGEAWSIGRGWCRMSGRSQFRPDRLREALHRPVRMLAGVPPELFADVPSMRPDAT